MLKKNIYGHCRMELIEELKQLPDFECYPLPKEWYKKYNLKFPAPDTVRESFENNYAFKTRKYDLPPIIKNEPIRDLSGNIILAQLHPPDEIEKCIEVKQKPFNPNDTNLVGFDINSFPKELINYESDAPISHE